MTEQTKDQTVSNPVEAVVSSELLYRDFEEHGVVAVGFECRYCESSNMFTGDDADFLEVTEKKSITKVECRACKKKSTLEQG